MSSSAPTKRQVQPNSLPPRKGRPGWFLPMFHSTVGGKIYVALTAIALTGFVIAHQLGNRQIFAGQEALNAYGQFLKDQGLILWIMRGILRLCLVVHMVLGVRFWLRSHEARPVGYVAKATVQAST